MTWKRLWALALGDPGERLSRTWPLLVGLVFGTATWIILAGFTEGASRWVRERVGGSLPNRIRVSSSKTTLGPLQLGGGMNADTVEACRKIPGVLQVYRQAHFPGPCQLFADYQDQKFTTDILLEGVDPGQVQPQLPPGHQPFTDTRSKEVPCVVPQPVLDILNAGISAHTNLPTLSADALIGRTFQMRVGASSFQQGPAVEIVCDIVGVSDQLGVNGPAVPMAWIERHATRPIEYHTLTLELDPRADLDSILRQIDSMALAAPDLDNARRINQMSSFGQAMAGAFSLAILIVAGTGIASGFTVKVQLEREDIGLYRSLGATRRDIVRLYLVRAAALGLQGALFGMLAGLLGGYGLARIITGQLPAALVQTLRLFQPTWQSMLLALCFAPLVAIGAAWVPSRRAAALEPGAILRGS